MGEESGVYRVLVGKPEGKRPLGRRRRRWVDNIRLDLQEVGCAITFQLDSTCFESGLTFAKPTNYAPKCK